MRDIGKNIRDLRERAGLTQEQLAEQLFVTRQTVSNYENGRTRPDVDTVIRIGELLGVDANAVLYGLPVQPERKKNILRLCCTGTASVLLLTVVVWVELLMREDDRWLYLFSGWKAALYILTMPAAMFLLGYTVLGGVSVALGFRGVDRPWVRWCRWGILGVAGLCLLMMIPMAAFFTVAFVRGLLQDSVTMSFPYIPVYSELSHGIMWLNRYWSPLWIIPGGVLALLRKPPAPEEKTSE